MPCIAPVARFRCVDLRFSLHSDCRYSKPGTHLRKLTEIFMRLDNLSHILVWTKDPRPKNAEADQAQRNREAAAARKAAAKAKEAADNDDVVRFAQCGSQTGRTLSCDGVVFVARIDLSLVSVFNNHDIMLYC